jgi:pSer/pThr/pTyr-binding forkhead associated (FHA) protein
MMARASTKPLDPVAVPALVPQGQHAGKQSMPISRPLTVIGSRHRAHLHLLSRSVSKSHAVIGMEDGGVYIRDLASRTHVYVNGKLIRESDLRDGDLVKIGSFTFKFTDKRKTSLLEKPTRSPAAAVEVDGSPVPIEFHGRVMLIGRRPTCDISLMEVSVSTCHAIIFEHNGQRIIRDLGSRTGTQVNGELIHQAPLNVGDQIRIGETDMKLVAHGVAPLHDELEDLVGTAPLGDEMLALAGEDLEAPPAPKAKPARAKAAPAIARAVPPIPPAPPIAPIPVAKPLVVEPEPEREIEFAPVAEAEETGHGTGTLDVSVEPPIAEPSAVEAEPLADEPAPLAIKAEETAPLIAATPPVVVEPPPSHGDVIKIEPDEPPHLLVDANLYTDAMSASGTFTGISGEVEQANSEAALDAAASEPVDLGLDFWHDEPPAVAARPAVEDISAEDEPLPLLGVEEPDDTVFGVASKAQEAPEAEEEIPEPTAETSQSAGTLPVGAEPAAVEEIEPVELGPELTSPAAAAEMILPGLVLPAAAIERASEAAPAIPPTHLQPLERVAEGAMEPAEPIDLSNVQFSPPAAEPAAEWESGEPETPAPTSLLGLDLTPTAPAAEGELFLPRASHEPQDTEAESAESTDVFDTEEPADESPDEPALKPKRKPRRRKTKVAAEPTEPTASAEPSAEPTAPAVSKVISELEPLAESAAEPTDSYIPLAPLVSPITESEVAATTPEAMASPAEEDFSSLEPLAPMEESFEPALDLEPLEPEASAQIELPIENDPEPTAADDALEFNFDEPAEGASATTAEEAGPAWIADAQTLLPTPPTGQIFEPTSLSPSPIEDWETPGLELATPDEETHASGVPDASIAPETDSEVTPDAPSEPELPVARTVAPMKLDPFRGMRNDLGSFIGGLPLPLPPVAKVPLDDGSSLTFAKPPAIPIAPLDVSEPPPELFDSEPEALDALPDALEKIEDVEQAIGKTQPAGTKPQGRMPPPPMGGRVKAPFGSTPLSAQTPSSPDIIAERKGKSPVTARRGQVTTAFDGLALQPVRQADVFSQMNSPGVDDAFMLDDDETAEARDAGDGEEAPIAAPTSLTGALPGPEVEPGRRNSRAFLDRKGLRPVRGGLGGEAVEADLLEADPSTADFGGPGVEQQLSVTRRVLPAQPTAPSPRFEPMPVFSPGNARFRRYKWLRVGVLLPLMILIAAGACAGIWLLAPVTYTHTADLTYTNLDKATNWQSIQFLKSEHDSAASEDTLKLAQAIYLQKGGKHGPGFLAPAEVPEKREQLAHRLSSLLDSMAIPPDTNLIEFHIDSNDRTDDALRLNAFVHAINVKDKPLVDAAGRLNAEFVDKRNQLNELASKIDQTNNALKAEQEASDRLQSLQESYSDLNSKVAQLLLARQAASRNVNNLEKEVRYLETSGAGVSTTQPAQTAAPANDSDTRDLAAQIDHVQSQLAAIHSANSSTADQANAALDNALRQFAQKVADAKTKLDSSSALTDYLVSAQQAQDAIAKVRAEVLDTQKTSQQDLSELKDQLATSQKRQNETVWAADKQLQTWQQDLEIQQHHYEAAQGGGLQDDAAKIKTDMDKLEAQIAARRDQLTAADPSNANITAIRQLVDKCLRTMRTEQDRSNQRMADVIQQLSTAAPNLSKLPADQKALAEDLEKQQDQLDKARQQYALALQSGPQSDASAKQLETQLADLNAKLSAHRQEVAEQNREISTKAETSALEQQLKEKDVELTVARQEEDAAFLEYAKYKESLAETKTELDSATALAAKRDDDNANLNALHNDFDQQSDEVNQAAARNASAVVPLAPPENVVQTSSPVDKRWQYMVGVVFATLLVFSPMIYFASQTSTQPRVPLARPVGAARPPITALPPRPAFAKITPASGPTSNSGDKLTSLTASIESDVDIESNNDEGNESSPDVIPANF